MQNPKHVVITGASSGLGRALARRYAAAGLRMGLIARRAALLQELAAELKVRGADVWTAALDVRDAESMKKRLEEEDARAPIELLIANAGISAGTFGAGESAEQTRMILATNFDGALNAVLPVIPLMTARGRGQIALVSSIAGFRGFPGAPAYCASKAAQRIWGEGLRGELGPKGVEVNVICPGYVDTPMTQGNPFPMPFIMSAGRAAAITEKGLRKNRARIAYPWPMGAAAWLLAALPPAWTDPLLKRAPKKPAMKRA